MRDGPTLSSDGAGVNEGGARTTIAELDHESGSGHRSAVSAGGGEARRLARLIRWVVVSAIGVTAGVHLLLLAPISDVRGCWRPVQVSAQLAYPLNCDSPDFVQLANNPGEILTKDNVRQSRPGFIALAVAGRWVVERVAPVFHLRSMYGQTDPSYMGYILINYGSLVIAVAGLGWLLSGLGVPSLANAALCAVLVVNDVTKAFFWTPHQQIFILLMPILTVLLVRHVLARGVTWSKAGLLGLGLGVAVLTYGSFLVTLLATAVAMAWHGWSGRTNRGLRWRLVGQLSALFAASLIPVAIWVQVCRWVAGSFYSHETARYDQFVWLPKAITAGASTTFAAIWHMTKATAIEIFQGAGPILAALGVMIVVGSYFRVLSVPDPHKRIVAAAVITIAVTVPFCWALGYFEPRFGAQVIPPTLLLIGYVVSRMASKSLWLGRLATVLLVLSAVAWVGYEVTKVGPYS